MKNKIDELLEQGYTIENALISSVDLSMEDHGWLTFSMVLERKGWGCVYGGICLGHGYLGAEHFDSTEKCGEYIMRIMDTVGVSRFQDLKGKYIRVASEGWGSITHIIGNIIEDKWFDQTEFFKN